MENFPIFTFDRTSSQVPSELWNVKKPPDRIYVQGKPESLAILDSLAYFGLAVVGTRQPQPRSRDLVRKYLRLISGSSLIIVSGLALGVDAVAHEAALDEKMPTIAVLAGGFNFIYPSENRYLCQRILENGGLLISECAPEVEPRPFRFLERNRLIAGWTRATWVVEAGYRSGALNTAKWAREQDKICFSTPCFPGDPTLAGNQVLIDRDLATPVWGAHSFANAWLDFASLEEYVKKDQIAQSRRAPLHLIQNKMNDQDYALIEQIRSLNAHLGGAQVTALVDWAMESGWSSEEFFVVFDRSVEMGLISHLSGIVSERNPLI